MDSGLVYTTSATTSTGRYSGTAAYLRKKCGSNCNPGIKRKAGNVMRLKTPSTATNANTAHEKKAECPFVLGS